ncbi:MAG: draG [Clostridiaceae bacterium]|jgi:ADP-ribosylglycohydrolase|nr:draG [Clostridiaceae bacterium]
MKNIFRKIYYKIIFNNKNINEKILSGILGLCIGDALGVPVEFLSREELSKNPIRDMIGYGKHDQPKGSWSDDSSMTFCFIESLCNGYNIDDIKAKFCDWYYNGYWTTNNTLPFDVGHSVSKAIMRINSGYNFEQGKEKSEWNNGNGSLMRILPLAFYLKNYNKNKFEIIEDVSFITHLHIRSAIACSIYVEFALNLLNNKTLIEAYEDTKKVIIDYYSKKGLIDELMHFDRILNNDISLLNINDIKSSGYVVDTLEASLWCLLNSNNYSEAVLVAVNLGEDTDTVGAVTGGLAGIYYGINDIPIRWDNSILRKNDIVELLSRFSNALI